MPIQCRVKLDSVARRARQRQRDANEFIRRIRPNSQPSRIDSLITRAARRAGDVGIIGKQIRDRLDSKNLLTALRGTSLLIALVRACDATETPSGPSQAQ